MARGSSVPRAGPSGKIMSEKSSGRSKGKRKAYDDDDDTDGEQVPAEDEDPDMQGELDQDYDEDGGIAKRARVNEEGDSRPGDKGKQREPKERVKTLPRDVDG